MIGVIADDFTGATDVAVALRRAGHLTRIRFGLPAAEEPIAPADALVVALKSRTTPPEDAVRESLAAARWLATQGATSVYFKFCSTFDSRPSGNIGPVADALADLLGSALTVVVPSSPEHGRTQYMGNLFVGPLPLAESHMRHHPVTPMTDSDVVRLMAGQTTRSVGLVDHTVVSRGRAAIAERLEHLEREGHRYAVVDAINDDDLTEIGFATAGAPFGSGAAGLAAGIGRSASAVHGHERATAPSGSRSAGRTVVLAGSCSARTLEQVARMKAGHPSYFLDGASAHEPETLASAALAWFDSLPEQPHALIYSSLPPAELAAVQASLGAAEASEVLEATMGLIARGLVSRGIQRLLIAGGETSGAVVTALDIDGGLIGEEAAPGVPWIHADAQQPIALLLKSGNFGPASFFTDIIDETTGER